MRNILVLILLAHQQSVMAAESAGKIATIEPVSSSYIGRITIGLALIILLIFLLAWVMKKMQLAPQSGQQLIKIISAISVGHRDRIALIQVGEEQILVGLTPGRIQKLHELKTVVEVSQSDLMNTAAFSEKFTQLMGRNKKNTGHENEL